METDKPTQPSWLDTIGGWVTTAGKIFTTGTEVYVGAEQRLAAIKSMNEDTVKTSAPAAPQIVSGIPSTWPSWSVPAIAVGLVLVGIYVARKMR